MRIYVMAIHHRHGANFYAHTKHEGLMLELEQFVTDWWHEVFPSEPIPEDLEKAVYEYFTAREDEYYDIQDVELGE